MSLEDLIYSRRKGDMQQFSYPKPVISFFLIGAVRHCTCYEEGAVHLLRMSKDPERLVPICGAGNTRWVLDNSETDDLFRDVTCQNCQRMIMKMEAES